jgi:hypothetical protein
MYYRVYASYFVLLLCNGVMKLRHATHAAYLNFCFFHGRVKFIVCIVLNGIVFYETKITKE